jgi:DNA polymerase III delta subunit
LFGNLQLIVISRVDTIKANLQEQLVKLCESTSPHNRLILQADKLASNSRLLKYFEKSKARLDLPELKGAQLKTWVQSELKLNGIKTSNLALVQSIIDLGQQSPDLISVMASQLGNYLNEGETLDEKAIAALFTANQEANQFEVAENIALAKVASTEVGLHRLLKNGLSSFVLLAIVAKAYQNSASYRLLKDTGQRDDEIARELNLNPWVLQKLQPIMRNYTKEQLLAHYWNFTRTDLKLKSKSIGEENIVSILAHSLMPENKKPHAQ